MSDDTQKTSGSRPLDQPVYKELSDTRDALAKIPDENAVMSSSQLGRRLVEFFYSYGFDMDTVVEKVGLSKGTANSLANGAFRLRDVAPLVNWIEKNSDSWTRIEDASAERWVDAREESVQKIVTVLSEKLSALNEIIKKSNELGTDESPINEVQKAQLIAMLEAMLALLKAPFIEQNWIAKRLNQIGRIFGKGVEDRLTKEVSGAVGGVVDAGGKAIDAMNSAPGSESLSDILNLPIS